MIRKFLILFSAFLILAFLLPACSPAPEITAQYDPAEIRFSGERAYEIEEEFVTTHTNRVSGSEESRQATTWLQDQFTAAGWTAGG